MRAFSYYFRYIFRILFNFIYWKLDNIKYSSICTPGYSISQEQAMLKRRQNGSGNPSNFLAEK